MKYVGIWWGMHLGVETWTMDERHGATTANAKRYIDFAAANNIEAVMFEGWNEGWESWGGMQTFDYTKPYADFDMAEVARYAKEKKGLKNNRSPRKRVAISLITNASWTMLTNGMQTWECTA